MLHDIAFGSLEIDLSLLFESSEPENCPMTHYLISSVLNGTVPVADDIASLFVIDPKKDMLIATTALTETFSFYLLGLSDSGRNFSIPVDIEFFKVEPEPEEPAAEEEEVAEEEEEEEKTESTAEAFVFVPPPPPAPVKKPPPPAVVEVSAAMFTLPNPVLR